MKDFIQAIIDENVDDEIVVGVFTIVFLMYLGHVFLS